jgi:hypothetical protein
MKKILLAVAVVGIFAVRVNADVLGSYPFTGSSRASTDSDANTSASAIVDGAGLVNTIDTTRGNPSPSITIDSSQTDGTNNTTTVSANDYIGFTLTPNSGVQFSLTSLGLDAANWSSTSTFPAESYFLRSSLDSFGANIGSVQSIAAGSSGILPNSFDLSGAAFQNLTTAIEFRLFVQDGTSTANRGLLFDNITLNGTTVAAAIPEPATWMLMGIGLLLGAQRLRRRS